ncbi:MAG: hypothetical protein RSB59_04615 [Clostridia bacterium]
MIKKKRAMIVFILISIALLITVLAINFASGIVAPKGKNTPTKRDIVFESLEKANQINKNPDDTKMINMVEKGNFVLTALKYCDKYYYNNIFYHNESGYTYSLDDIGSVSFTGYSPYMRTIESPTPSYVSIFTFYVDGEYVTAIYSTNSAHEKEIEVKDSLDSKFETSIVSNSAETTQLFLATMQEMSDDYIVYIDGRANQFSRMDYAKNKTFQNILIIMLFVLEFPTGIILINYHYSKKQKKELQKLKDVL